ncbi:hypothetical protein [Kaarinaea lacus]
MARKTKTLLNVITLGAHPDFTALYRQHGFEIITAKTLRKALALIKQASPNVIVAEFIYAPTYGSQLSNFESLFAAAQNFAPTAHFIALLHQNDLEHLEKVKGPGQTCSTLFFPVSLADMDDCLTTIDEVM